MNVLIIIPAYNEENNISEVIHGIRTTNPEADILVIDDGSLDQTAEVAARAGAKVISHVLNTGYGGALQTGYRYATSNNYDILSQIDGDGQHDPRFISQMISLVESEKADLVIGSRFLKKGASYKVPVSRRIGMKLFQSLIYLLTRKNISDPTSGYQTMSRRVFSFFARGNVFPSDYPDADVIVLLLSLGFKITEIPVVMYESNTGQSMHNGLRPIFYMIKMFLSLYVTKTNKNVRIR